MAGLAGRVSGSGERQLLAACLSTSRSIATTGVAIRNAGGTGFHVVITSTVVGTPLAERPSHGTTCAFNANVSGVAPSATTSVLVLVTSAGRSGPGLILGAQS